MAENKAVNEEQTNEVATQSNEVAENKSNFAAFGELGFLEELGYTADDLAELTGMDNLDSSDVIIPYATLINKDGDANNPKGNLILPGGQVIKGFPTPDGEAGEYLEGVSILNIQPVRVYFPEKFNANNSYICRSTDGRTGTDGEYAGRACSECEFAKYPEEGGASPCRDQRLLLCATKDTVFQLIISGVGMRVFREFISQQMMKTLPSVKNLWLALNLDLHIKVVETENGKFAAPHFVLNEKSPINDRDTIQEHITLLKSYKEYAVENAATAATAASIQRSAGDDEGEVKGENTNLF